VKTTKAQLIKATAFNTGFSQKKTSEIYKVILDIITSTLADGESISIRGFGKFYLNDQKERKIKHPLTGQTIIVNPKKTVKFRSFKFLREQINGFGFDYDKFMRQNKIILHQLYDLIENSGDYEEEEEEEQG
jgi:nucleoid DNA-binding protein